MIFKHETPGVFRLLVHGNVSDRLGWIAEWFDLSVFKSLNPSTVCVDFASSTVGPVSSDATLLYTRSLYRQLVEYEVMYATAREMFHSRSLSGNSMAAPSEHLVPT